ncbi:MAG TPA: tRNA preQ1(34) S-adenosylmethionine ribosyltransferase-isomerase QueA [Candidatus Omnitrophota bacterium]|nr:tRNA preQ1(34) S-adenosylmethionine ribosyltransferase-isomerase QueA [Candidatus Omnitrophota bacterium]
MYYFEPAVEHPYGFFKTMKLSDFDYSLPEHLIAQEPLHERDEARLLVVDRKAGTVQHDVFKNLREHLPPGGVLVLNNSRVIPARLLGQKQRSGGQVEIFLLKRCEDPQTFETLLRPTRKIKQGDVIEFKGADLTAEIIDKEKRVVRFDRKDVLTYLTRVGHIPLPPYIKRADTPDDRTFYQTVYAKHFGSVAAPTAGLHFTKPLLQQLRASGHRVLELMLHVNYATFKPVEEEDVTRHQMHQEEYSVSQRTYEQIKRAKLDGKKIVAVGTTSCRTLEAISRTGNLKSATDLFLYPGCRFEMTDILITNFHLPRSTLLMLVYAFGGTDLMRMAYQEAIQKEYRFYSYGDAMIIR